MSSNLDFMTLRYPWDSQAELSSRQLHRCSLQLRDGYDKCIYNSGMNICIKASGLNDMAQGKHKMRRDSKR